MGASRTPLHVFPRLEAVVIWAASGRFSKSQMDNRAREPLGTWHSWHCIWFVDCRLFVEQHSVNDGLSCEVGGAVWTEFARMRDAKAAKVLLAHVAALPSRIPRNVPCRIRGAVARQQVVK